MGDSLVVESKWLSENLGVYPFFPTFPDVSESVKFENREESGENSLTNINRNWQKNWTLLWTAK